MKVFNHNSEWNKRCTAEKISQNYTNLCQRASQDMNSKIFKITDKKKKKEKVKDDSKYTPFERRKIKNFESSNDDLKILVLGFKPSCAAYEHTET